MQSTAAQIIITVIPIVGIVFGATLIFFYFLWNHKQRMLLIKHDRLERKPFNLNIFSLFTGILLFGIGTALTAFFAIKEGVSYALLGGLIPLTCGISLLQFYHIRTKNYHARHGKE